MPHNGSEPAFQAAGGNTMRVRIPSPAPKFEYIFKFADYRYLDMCKLSDIKSVKCGMGFAISTNTINNLWRNKGAVPKW